MPTSSTKDRKIRKLKRERTLAYRMVDAIAMQRDQARLISVGLERELKKYITEYGQLTPPEPTPEVSPAVNKIADMLEGEPSKDIPSA